MPKPSSCKKSAAPKFELPLEDRYARADIMEEIKNIKKKVKDGVEKAKRIAELMEAYNAVMDKHKKKNTQISMDEYDARKGKTAIPDDKGPNSGLPADSD